MSEVRLQAPTPTRPSDARPPAGLRATIAAARRALIDTHYHAGVGHLGGNLSCIEALVVLHCDVLGEDDRFILSTGHSAGALYIALWTAGKLPTEALATFHAEGTLLAGHPPLSGLNGVRFATGSLGHGLGLAAGVALAARMKGNKARRVFCLLSDGEWQEGSNWEALIFTVHQRLANLTLMIDVNGLQGFGATAEVASLVDLAPRLTAFGIECIEIDGHDPAALLGALECTNGRGPRAILMRTVKGRGVPSMAGCLESHYLPLSRTGFPYSRCGSQRFHRVASGLDPKAVREIVDAIAG